jgi:hypothetical protein
MPTPRVRRPDQADRWTRLVLLSSTELRLARRAIEDRHPLGAAATSGPPRACARPGAAGVSAAPARSGHPRRAKTLCPLTGPARRAPLGPGTTLPGHQKGRLSSTPALRLAQHRPGSLARPVLQGLNHKFRVDPDRSGRAKPLFFACFDVRKADTGNTRRCLPPSTRRPACGLRRSANAAKAPAPDRGG